MYYNINFARNYYPRVVSYNFSDPEPEDPYLFIHPRDVPRDRPDWIDTLSPEDKRQFRIEHMRVSPNSDSIDLAIYNRKPGRYKAILDAYRKGTIDKLNPVDQDLADRFKFVKEGKLTPYQEKTISTDDRVRWTQWDLEKRTASMDALQRSYRNKGMLFGGGLGAYSGYMAHPKSKHRVRNAVIGALAGTAVGGLAGHFLGAPLWDLKTQELSKRVAESRNDVLRRTPWWEDGNHPYYTYIKRDPELFTGEYHAD